MIAHPLFEFHASTKSRKKYDLNSALYSTQGRIVFANFNAARELALQLQQNGLDIMAADLNAFGLMDEVIHLLIESYRKSNNPELFKQLEASTIETLGADGLDKILLDFGQNFPPTAVYKNEISLSDYLASEDNRENMLQELILLWLENRNPAYSLITEFIDEKQLKHVQLYRKLFKHTDVFFKEQPLFGGERISFLEYLQLPAKKYPHSIMAQFQYIVDNWSQYLGPILNRLLISMDFIREEQMARFDSAVFGPGPTEITTFGESHDFEPEQFSADLDWMPHVVLMAKSTYVWLDQLSKQYQQSITRLDQIPDDELDMLSNFGFTGLWLIGLWERSRASQRIKQIAGNPEAVSSAYSLYDYQIADDLGGEEAYKNLKNRTRERGIRLASDMVPNHMGIDSRWLMEHPDWFIQSDDPPFPTYTFNGADLSDDDRVGIFIEDGYWNKTDASVVFKRWDRHTGSVKYIYHGNDGTTMPWNDTAQLNYLIPEVREALIQTILHVARKFPIIRFDAAMTLAKKHFQRLWFPEPGHGGDIPSRAEHSLGKDKFNEFFPVEFWREVVDRVAKEVPDTLLLAEAFWMMEGYFVRSLGMHRVYNSAFMNMLKNEENQKYRQSIKNVLEFNPQILKRYVNFMNNPDEDTAVEQFGKEDKYFGICLLMATMPGLPMFGHGQIEGFAEKYGMEYRRAYWDEHVDQHLVERHKRDIFPLLKKRYLFSDVQHFLLYDFYTADGSVNENVFAYSNRAGNEKSIVVYNNKYDSAAGWINCSAAYLESEILVQKNLVDGLALGNESADFILFKEFISGNEYIRDFSDFRQNGMYIELGAFKYQVYGSFRIVSDSEERPYRSVFNELTGRGTESVEHSVDEWFFRDLLTTLEQTTNPDRLHDLLQNKNSENFMLSIDNLMSVIQEYEGVKGLTKKERLTLEKQYLNMMALFPATPRVKPKNYDPFKLPGLLFLFYYVLWEKSETSKNNELKLFFEKSVYLNPLSRPSAEQHSTLDLPADFSKLVPISFWFAKNLSFPESHALPSFFDELLTIQSFKDYLGINRFEDVVYFNREQFELLLDWLLYISLWMNKTSVAKQKARLSLISELKKSAENSGYRLKEFLQTIVRQTSE